MACRVEDQIRGTLLSLDEETSVRDAAERMASHGLGFLVVTREGSVAGLFTEQDLLRRVVGEGRDPDLVLLKEVSTRDLVSVDAGCDCLRAIAKMQAHGCRRLLVYRRQRLLGVVGLTDLANAVARQGSGRDLLVNAVGLVTVALAVGVIAVMLLQLPEMMQLAGSLGAAR
jgi:CBS domain-containing protein